MLSGVFHLKSKCVGTAPPPPSAFNAHYVNKINTICKGFCTTKPHNSAHGKRPHEQKSRSGRTRTAVRE